MSSSRGPALREGTIRSLSRNGWSLIAALALGACGTPAGTGGASDDVAPVDAADAAGEVAPDVAEDASPDATLDAMDSADDPATPDATPDDAAADGSGEDAGRGIGEICVEDADCLSFFCVDPGSGAESFCADFCPLDGECPDGFECVVLGDELDAQRLCVPTQVCIDRDGDGFGLGPGCRGPDCDDDAAGVNFVADEICNGVDDDCDDAVDENAVGAGAACATGFPGRCGAGVNTCVEGSLTCVAPTPVDETCNLVDDDCDGQID